ncbi:dTDP-4-dehydrorhamnose reductase [Bacillus songklensis]|uniref:dTDP-4-dehydrorhamnose reductase n=1 Tax=Bacillus songklensis TaxID=1069116 RepID=A0ABV8B2B6_9BACI
MSVMVTGASGRLGKELVSRLRECYEVYALTKKELDVTNKENVHNLLHKLKPACIFHCAAYTDVDVCEDEYERAFEINSFGTLNIAKAAKEAFADLVYISTGHVFDGMKKSPYLEKDKPNPINVYGESKRLGERFVLLVHPESYVIRTSWLYGKSSHNFVNMVLEKAKQEEEIRVINDQFGSPTNIQDLAETLTTVTKYPYGIYHISNEGCCSWFELAQYIYKKAGVDQSLVVPVPSEPGKLPARRPAYSALGGNADFQMRSWKEALNEYIHEAL